MDVYVYLRDTDNSCSDPECCGGPCPSLVIRVFSSIKDGIISGIKASDLKKVTLNYKDSISISAL